MVKIEKYKKSAKMFCSDGSKRVVNFFLRQYAEEHTGKEFILDILNSRATFIPLEDVQTNEFFLLNKKTVMYLELGERELSEETKLFPELPARLELTSGKVFVGTFLIDTPPERSRLSDYLNFSPQFIYLCRDEGDLIFHKLYVHSVKND